MQRRLSIRRVCTLSVMVACGALAAYAEDMALFMPCDTAVYAGWSQWLAPDAPELRMQKKLIAAVTKAASQPSDDFEAPAWLTPLLDLIEPLQTGSVGFGLFDVRLVSGQPEIDAALLVAGPEARTLPEAVHKLFATAVGEDRIEPHVIQNTTLECARLEGIPLVPIWGRHKEYFIFASSDAAAGKVIDCIDNRAPSLATTDEFVFDRQKVGAQGNSRHFCLYVDAQRVLTRGKQIATQALGELPPTVDQALDELGLTALRSKYLQVDALGGQPRVMAFAHVAGPLRGLFKFWDQKPLIDDDIRVVPRDAYWAAVCDLDLAGLWDEAMRVFAALAPDKLPLVQGPLAIASQMLGFSITDNLLPAFGDTWALFDAPAHGGILLSGTVLVAEAKDPDALQGMFKRLVELATPLATQGKVTLKPAQLQDGEHTIQYVLIGGVPCPVAPAWGFVNDHVVFGLFPQTVATAMQQVDPKTRGESLLDQPDFKTARALLPKDAQSIGYFDTRYFARMVYPFVNLLRTAGISALAKYGAEIDLALMPPLPQSVAKVTNHVGVTSTDPDGILYASRGDGAPLAVAAGGAALVTSVMLPSLARAREVAKRAVSASNLRGIGQSCLIYANEHQGRFPDSLDQLLQAGFVIPKMLQSPRDPTVPLAASDRRKLETLGYVPRASESGSEATYTSYVYIVGQTVDSKPDNILVYERLFDNDGTNILFVDGHVEWLKLDDFKTAAQETYRRLGREADLPPELRPEKLAEN